MATLKDKINRILGNNVRLLLPSYWWKRLFGLISDEVETLKNNLKNTTSNVSEIQKELPKKFIIYSGDQSRKEDNINTYNALIKLTTEKLKKCEIYLDNGTSDSIRLLVYDKGSDYIRLYSDFYRYSYSSGKGFKYHNITLLPSGITNDYTSTYNMEGVYDRNYLTSVENLITDYRLIQAFKFSIDITGTHFQVRDALRNIITSVEVFPTGYNLNFRVSDVGFGYYITRKESALGPITLYWRDNYGGMWESTITEETNIWVHKTNYGGTIIFGETLDEESKTKNLEFLKDNSPNIGTFLKNIEDGSMYRLLSYKQSASSTDIWDLYISRNGITEHWTVNTTDGTTSLF